LIGTTLPDIEDSMAGRGKSTIIANKYQRVLQVYHWYRTARLNVLYYEELLKKWTRIVQTHDLLIAVTSASSPIAFWKHSSDAALNQGWFYLTLSAALLGIAKPIIKWEKKVALYAELHAQYCDLAFDLKFLTEDITASQDFSESANAIFESSRKRFRDLERKEPPADKKRVRRLEKVVINEFNIDDCWFPNDEHEGEN
jgi:hypothetical protein